MSKKLDRRSFLKGATATAAASSLGFPALVNAGGHGGTTLKVQAAWGVVFSSRTRKHTLNVFTRWQVRILKLTCSQ